MAIIDLSIQDALKTHRKKLQRQEWEEASKEKRSNGVPSEVEIVNGQLKDVEFECECGGTYDEYDRCSDCSNGHDDCSPQECFACMERATDRAEMMAEGAER